MKKGFLLLLLILFSNAVIGQSFTLISKSPTPVSNSVALNSDITLNFSASTESSTIIADNIIITGKNTGIIAGSFSGGGTTTVVFNPTTDFKAGEVITITLTTSVQNASNAALSNPQTYIFTTKSSLTSFEPSFTTSDIYSSADNIRSVFSADLDGDGDMDIISGSENDDKIAWHENDGNANPSFASTTIATSADGVYSIYVTDIDSDGDMDIVSASIKDNTIAWYENDGNATPDFTARDITTSASGATNVSAADMDNDGDMDIISVSHNDNKISWYENDGAPNPNFIKHDINEAVNGFLYSIFAADMDGDGDMDMVTASANNDRIDWYENDGAPDPNFTITNVATSADGARCIFVADMDNDGDMDIISASKSDNTIAWYENDGAANPDFTAINIYTSALIAFSVYAADMDNDGDMDIVSGSTGDAKIIWHENDGEANPGFTTADINSYIDEHANTIFVADVDGDGDLDIISGSGDDDSIAWHENSPESVNTIPFSVAVNSDIICSSGIATIVATPSPAGFYSYTWIVPVGVDNPGNVQSFSTSVEGDYSVSISKDNYLCNTDFEDNQIVNPGNYIIINQDSVPCWETTASDSKIEVWGDGFMGFDAYSGNQFIELNANMRSTLFQDFEIIPGSSALISFAHRGRNSSADDIMEVEIGPIGGPYTNLGSFSDGTDAWGYYSLEYLFPDDLGINYTIRFKSLIPASPTSEGNFLDDINVVFSSSVSSEIVSIITDIIPTFTQVDPICNGDDLGELPTESNNGITGTWSPAIDNTLTTTYTFTPDITQPGQACTINQPMTITVNPLITPTFTQINPICNGEALAVLPTTSNNGVTGIWSPAIDNTLTTTYTFTPDAGQCAVTSSIDIVVNPIITPSFSVVNPICSGDSLPNLPSTSSNGVTGTWSPAMNNTATTTYTFTPDAGQCAVTSSIDIVVNPIITPSFSTVNPICSGDTLPNLPSTSSNGVTGTWSPSLDNTTTTTYTFTPDTGQCAVTSSIDIVVNPIITPSFSTVNPICSGDTLPNLPSTSSNGVTGTWSPSLDNTTTTTYTFTPDTGQCAVTSSIDIVVNPIITPSFSAVNPICSGDSLPNLPLTSSNGVTGTWSPSLDNTTTTTYTFTPDTGQCAVTSSIDIVVNPIITPSFSAVNPICSGDALSNLPSTSSNGISGTWSPAMNNTATTTYTFTPDAGQCAVTSSIEIVVNPIITPSFSAVNPICSGDTLPNLPSTSSNGISGTWSPTINNTATTTYTFTPDAGQCAVTSSIDIVVNPIITPSFSAVNPICSGDSLPNLPSTSSNGVTGTWSPTINNTATTTYTFTPDTGQCAVTSSIDIVVNPIITPSFSAVNPICSGDSLPNLPSTSSNGVTGTWSPTINNTATTTYTFTPDTGQCAVTSSIDIVVNPIITPSFSAVNPICSGDTLPNLPSTSSNGISGTWSPTINNTATTTYTFTPDTGQCAVTSSIDIVVNPIITPSFSAVNPICSGDTLPNLPSTSSNGVTGTWSPSLDNTTTTTYTFTPDTGQCAVTSSIDIVVNPIITPSFSAVNPICSGDTLPNLPSNSSNGVTGTWSPSLDNTTTTTYTFTPDTGQCAETVNMTIEVNSDTAPTFTQIPAICSGDDLSELLTTSNNGIIGTWSPSLDSTTTTTYTFTPDAGQCAETVNMTIEVNSDTAPTFTQIPAICSGDDLSELLTTSNNGIIGTWSPSLDSTTTTTYTFTPDAGQCAVTSSIDIVVNPIITPFFNAVNPIRSGDPLSNLPSTSNNGVTGTWSPAMNNTATTNYTFTPTSGQCAVTSNIEIVVSNINNAFSPNGDGVNDTFIIPILFNYLDFEIEIFNRWGTKVYYYNNNGSTNPSWWDGYATVGLLQGNSKPLTVGTYYYIIHLNNKVKEKITGWIYLNR